MFRRVAFAVLAALWLGFSPAPALAALHEGDLAPDFHKLDVDGFPHTLYQYRGKVVFMFLLGYN